jgi:tRNA (guanine6-N2)-methyltransferase
VTAGFRALRLEAAGRDSEVMRRLAAALAEGVGLPLDPEAGDLVVRARPDGEGWALLVRTTRRPLATRPWRVCDRPGGLNASLAAALAWLAAPPGGVVALNAFSGSGTLAIELALADPRARVEGIDLDPEAVACARRNAVAAGVDGRVRFEVGDVTGWTRAGGPVDLVLADPPWGDAVGSRERNRALYPAFLAQAASWTRPGGRLVVVTHEVALTAALLRERGPWRVVHERRVWHGGHHPSVLVLDRAGRP